MKKKWVKKLVVLGLTGIMALGVGCSKKEKTVNISSMSSDELADYLESLPKDEQERIKKSLDNKDKDDKTDKENIMKRTLIKQTLLLAMKNLIIINTNILVIYVGNPFHIVI